MVICFVKCVIRQCCHCENIIEWQLGSGLCPRVPCGAKASSSLWPTKNQITTCWSHVHKFTQLHKTHKIFSSIIWDNLCVHMVHCWRKVEYFWSMPVDIHFIWISLKFPSLFFTNIFPQTNSKLPQIYPKINPKHETSFCQFLNENPGMAFML